MTSLDIVLPKVLWEVVASYCEPWESNAVLSSVSEGKWVVPYSKLALCRTCLGFFRVPYYTDNLLQKTYCSKDCAETAFLRCLVKERELEFHSLCPEACDVCHKSRYGMCAVEQLTYVGSLEFIMCDPQCYDRWITYAYGILIRKHRATRTEHYGAAQRLFVKSFTS
jgi:hypothetical protein